MKSTSRIMLSAACLSILSSSVWASSDIAAPTTGTTAPITVSKSNDSINNPPHKEGKLDPKEIHAAMKARWLQADTDKDGQISKAEAQAMDMKWLLKHFEEIDTNKDGKISEAEKKIWKQAHQPQHTGDVKENPEHPYHDMAFKSPEQRRAAMMNHAMKADTDKDGSLSRAEIQATAMPRLLEHFDEIDTNKDGKLSLEELNAAWNKHKAAEAHKAP